MYIHIIDSILSSHSSHTSHCIEDSTDKDHLEQKTLSPLADKKPFKSASEATIAYWDNISKILLTQSPLNEPDRWAPSLRQISIESQTGLQSGEITELSTQSKRFVK